MIIYKIISNNEWFMAFNFFHVLFSENSQSGLLIFVKYDAIPIKIHD